MSRLHDTSCKISARPYGWPHDNSLSPATTALVVVDMQNDFCSEEGYLAYLGHSVAGTRAAIPNIARLLRAFRQHGYPVYHTREGHRPDLSTLSSRELFRSRNTPSGVGIGDQGPLGRLLVRGERGHDVVPELYPLPAEPIIDKPGRSAFAYTDFELLLKVRGVQKLVICGVTTDVCVHSTMREGNDRGCECLLVEDATGAALEELHPAAVKMVQHSGGIFGATASTDEVLEGIVKAALQ
ncbi:putative Peroxyureidoacrylate/ureidoacrylate amidohydrolase RutB [Daedalea quercina L-15889]|uniref:Putative Peroxyureidoacrylate/ureidoacrylate amidohydrolase RutB n=1 Tax=Daedalea quercina L-15889 TaxID=1314783 RepID=A0A165R5S5_9APHY|nr:putative Peroxyureidoacrylate/ureidoacrylate amidohydrolase RutB [Daedalea quercina L-15889]